jgi:hypothetical protein
MGASNGLFKCFGFFDEAYSSLLEGDYQLAGKLFRDDVQFPESTTELLFPDRVQGFYIGDDLSADIAIFFRHNSLDCVVQGEKRTDPSAKEVRNGSLLRGHGA